MTIYIMILLIIALIFMPEQIGKKKNPYDVIRKNEKKKTTKQPIEETSKIWKKTIILARKVQRYVPLKISPQREEKKQKKINYA